MALCDCIFMYKDSEKKIVIQNQKTAQFAFNEK